MPVLIRGVVARTFYAPAACCCCLLLLLAKACCSALAPKRWCKTSQGKSRLELGPSWVLNLRNAWETTVEERPLPLEMCLHGTAMVLKRG